MDRFLFRAAIKIQNYSILVDVSEVFTSGYSVLIDSIIDAFQNKYPDADVWGFIEMLENIPNCSEISDQAGVVLFDTFEGLLQCTNLKDKNGNLIYEGDIVYDSVYENNFVVSWDNDRTGYVLSANNTNHIDYLSKIFIERHNLKIIGNIHEQKDNK